MRAEYGDLWAYLDRVDAICITTNGVVKRDGTAVMGAGIAAEARRRFPHLPRALGAHLECAGNVPVVLGTQVGSLDPPTIISFPTKHDWRTDSSIELIMHSALRLVDIANVHGYAQVALPAPGCGNGGLVWSVVRPVIAPILDDRFVVVLSPLSS